GLLWCLILAIVGARLYHVFTPSPSMAEVGINSPADYFRNPMQLINLRRGGLGIYGGIAGGALGLLLYSYRHRMSALKWADVAVIGVALGQFVGRWGNFFNQELYGAPTTVPWAVWIEPQYRLSGFTEFNRFHPAFLYESIWNLLAFVVLFMLWRRYRRRLLDGDIMASYLILYAVGRVLMELVRLDSRPFSLAGLTFDVPVATVVSVVVALAMVAWIVWRHRKAEAS
ncbi:MAG: prolipoprotein diacylglyceryl transferase, partial [Chloroflexota bacterium]